MKKNLKRVFALVLTTIITVCMCSCSKEEKTSQENEVTLESAYKTVLEELVEEYGIPTVIETTYKGVLDFEIIDLNDDKKNELFVICSKGENSFFSAIYSFENNEAVKKWETDYNGAFDNAYVKKQNGKTCAFLTTSYRGWNSGIIAYEGDKFTDLYKGEAFNEEEKVKYNEASQRGIGEEDNIKIEIYLNRIGLTLKNSWEEVASLSAGGEIMGTPIVIKNEYRRLATECKNKLKELGIKQNESAEDILAKIPYYGDRSICKMDADMAKAYADAIESMEEIYISDPGESWSREYELCALLADPAGDGMPILITAYLNKYEENYYGEDCEQDYGELYEVYMWGYKDGKAVNAKVQEPDYTNGFGTIDGKIYYRSIEFFHDVGHKCTANYYLIEDGTITSAHSVDIYDVSGNAGDDESLYGEIPADATYQMTSSDLAANGWISVGDTGSSVIWKLIMHNGENVTRQCFEMWHDEIVGFSQTEEIAHISDIENHFVLRNDDAWNVAEALREFSEN